MTLHISTISRSVSDFCLSALKILSPVILMINVAYFPENKNPVFVVLQRSKSLGSCLCVCCQFFLAIRLVFQVVFRTPPLLPLLQMLVCLHEDFLCMSVVSVPVGI